MDSTRYAQVENHGSLALFRVIRCIVRAIRVFGRFLSLTRTALMSQLPAIRSLRTGGHGWRLSPAPTSTAWTVSVVYVSNGQAPAAVRLIVVADLRGQLHRVLQIPEPVL